MSRASFLTLLLACGGGEKLAPTKTDIVARLEIVGGQSQTGIVGESLPIPLTVRAVDETGKPLAGIPVTFFETAGGGTVTRDADRTDADGLISAAWQVGVVAGSQGARASVTDQVYTNEVVAEFAATALPGPLHVFRSDAPQAAGVVGTELDPIDVEVVVRDRYGNPLQGVAVSFEVGGGGGALMGLTASTTDADGRARPGGAWRLGPVRGINTLLASTFKEDGQKVITVVSALAGEPFKAVSVDVGGTHACALTEAGDVFCWGSNSRGQLGDGSTVRRNEAVVVQTGGRRFTQISAGGSHTCGLLDDGTPLCWGLNADGITGDRLLPTAPTLPPGVTFASITAGEAHSCALTSGGEAYCWGSNSVGNLGRGPLSSGAHPPAPVATSDRFVTIEANNQRQTCAVRLDGAVLCWGSLIFGPHTFASNLPVSVFPSWDFTSIVGGSALACGLDAQSSPWCWGYWSVPFATFGPLRVPGAPETRLLALGGTVSARCLLGVDDAAYCWGSGGSGDFGGLGPVGGSLRFTTLSAGQSSVCGVTRQGLVMCSGSNSEGQLGYPGQSTVRRFIYVHSP